MFSHTSLTTMFHHILFKPSRLSTFPWYLTPLSHRKSCLAQPLLIFHKTPVTCNMESRWTFSLPPRFFRDLRPFPRPHPELCVVSLLSLVLTTIPLLFKPILRDSFIEKENKVTTTFSIFYWLQHEPNSKPKILISLRSSFPCLWLINLPLSQKHVDQGWNLLSRLQPLIITSQPL